MKNNKEQLLLYTSQQYISKLLNVTKNENDNSHLIIFTYGIWAGYTFAHEDSPNIYIKYTNLVTDMLNRLNGKHDIIKTKIYIGIDTFSRDINNDKHPDIIRNHYKDKLIKQCARLLDYSKLWPNIQWYFSSLQHLKCVLYFNDDNIKNNIFVCSNSNLSYTDENQVYNLSYYEQNINGIKSIMKKLKNIQALYLTINNDNIVELIKSIVKNPKS